MKIQENWLLTINEMLSLSPMHFITDTTYNLSSFYPYALSVNSPILPCSCLAEAVL